MLSRLGTITLLKTRSAALKTWFLCLVLIRMFCDRYSTRFINGLRFIRQSIQASMILTRPAGTVVS